MSTHPNAMLMVILKPQGLSRKTMRSILSDNGVDDIDDDVTIGGHDYSHLVMEDDYEGEYQISASEGDLVFFDLVTYGYGEKIKWEDIEEQKVSLEIWAKETCNKHLCEYEIFISANYW